MHTPSAASPAQPARTPTHDSLLHRFHLKHHQRLAQLPPGHTMTWPEARHVLGPARMSSFPPLQVRAAVAAHRRQRARLLRLLRPAPMAPAFVGDAVQLLRAVRAFTSTAAIRCDSVSTALMVDPVAADKVRHRHDAPAARRPRRAGRRAARLFGRPDDQPADAHRRLLGSTSLNDADNRRCST